MRGYFFASEILDAFGTTCSVGLLNERETERQEEIERESHTMIVLCVEIYQVLSQASRKPYQLRWKKKSEAGFHYLRQLRCHGSCREREREREREGVNLS